MNRYQLITCALVVATACSPELPENYKGADTGLAVAKSSRAKDSLIILKDSLLAEKDRQLSFQSAMIGDAATTSRLISEIDRDLAKARVNVKDEKKAESTIEKSRASLARTACSARLLSISRAAHAARRSGSSGASR